MENKNNPTLKLQDIELGKSIELKLKVSRPYATGSNSYGNWNLWGAEVKDFVVYEGRGKEEKKIENYSGEVVFFPTENVHNDIISLVGENEGVTIKVTKEARENKKGVYSAYLVEQIGGGNTPLSNKEKELIDSVRDLIRSKAVENISLEQFLEGSCSDPYNLDKTRSKELYELYIKCYNE